MGALRSVIPHPKYKDKMHSLLDVFMPCEDARDIIIEYCQVGYRWYRFEYKTNDGERDYDAHLEEGAMIYDVKYDDDDYFRDNRFYKKPKASRGWWSSDRGGAVSFAEWRDDLDAKYMKNMTDDDLAAFLGEVDYVMLSGAFGGKDGIKWLIEAHA